MSAVQGIKIGEPSPRGLERPDARRRSLWRKPPVSLLLLLPALAAIGASFVYPMLWVVRMSLNEAEGPSIIETLSLRTYAGILSDPFTWKVTLNTLQLGVTVTIFATLLSYPLALFLTRTQSRFRGLLITLAVAPLLTSQVVRTYGWLVLLGERGVVNKTLMGLGVITAPLQLVNNFTGTTISLVEIFMPFTILVMMSGFGGLSRDLEQAAASLGANGWKVFWRVTLPLSRPGIMAASLFVFVLTISAFVSPSLVGGGRVFVLSTEIFLTATNTLNWPQASALSMILLAIFSLAIGLYMRGFAWIGGRR